MPEMQEEPIDPGAMLEDPTGRLTRYLERTETPLDLLALLTLWLVTVPPGDFGVDKSVVIGLRTGLSAVYAVDLTIRSYLAKRHLRYVRTHPLNLLVVLMPPLRVLMSLRLIRSIFRRGSLPRFLVAATILVANAAIATYFYERNAPHSNIHTLGESIWWSLVTVTTVGYGDYYPVTTLGRIAAVLIMATGILTLAVVTAQVASSFVDQSSRRAVGLDSGSPLDAAAADYTGASTGGVAVDPVDGHTELTLADLADRLSRIEELLAAVAASGASPGGHPEE
jgi:voltage-gated potassium channel